MSKRAEKAALKAYPPFHINCDGEVVSSGYDNYTRTIYRKGYEQAEKDLAKAILAEYKKQCDLCPDADKNDDYTISETQQLGRFMMMEDLYEKFCEPVGVTLDDLEDE